MIDVIWWDASRGNWDHGLLMSIFDKYPDSFIQDNTKTPYVVERAIVVVTGHPEKEALKAYLRMLKSGLVIFTSDEEARWDIPAIVPDHLEVWSQYYKPGMDVAQRLLMGQPSRLKDYKINKTAEKKYLWSFVGQVQNPFRESCVNVLKGLPDGFLRTTDLFGGVCEKAIEYQQYLDIMCQSKYVICPAGSFTPESFRLYEAMECGAIPITDIRGPVHPKGFDYWKEVYPENELLTVSDWNGLVPFFNSKLSHEITDERNQWWGDYKTHLENKLISFANG